MEKKRTFYDLIEIVRKLRSEGGCPWDRKQTHDSLTGCIEEESGEVVSAIKNQDMENLCEELGDLLYLIVMNAEIAEDNKEFSMEDITEGICAKMVRRHPNVFGDVKVNSWEEGVDLWNQIKKQEKSKKP